ncbi:hypothetical protein Vi05172_g4829 [Venturia inaequalis]|nr:hypothetical protein Vi05172_g4829 [Venturia inaequalis]
MSLVTFEAVCSLTFVDGGARPHIHDALYYNGYHDALQIDAMLAQRNHEKRDAK